MDIISVKQSANLFWLGRYSERVYSTLNFFSKYYDIMLDKDKNSYTGFLAKMGVPDVYGDHERFISGYLYGGAGCGVSVSDSFRYVYDNAILIRDTIGSESLAYIQLAINAFNLAPKKKNLMLGMMPVTDYLFAFWGCIYDKLAHSQAGTIIKCGKISERLDLCCRFDKEMPQITSEYEKLCHMIEHIRTGSALQINELKNFLATKESCITHMPQILNHLTLLFEENLA
jgi:uncharacterized alpha-E superfamily protein